MFKHQHVSFTTWLFILQNRVVVIFMSSLLCIKFYLFNLNLVVQDNNSTFDKCLWFKFTSQKQRRATNGISMSAMSLFKAAGPAGGGAMYVSPQLKMLLCFFSSHLNFKADLITFVGCWGHKYTHHFLSSYRRRKKYWSILYGWKKY